MQIINSHRVFAQPGARTAGKPRADQRDKRQEKTMSSTTQDVTLIQPAPVERDAEGWWSHPGIPDFDEDHAAYKAWLEAQGLDIKYTLLDDEDDEHPVRQSYFDNEDTGVSAWEVAPPRGEGWFVLSIHDTEDGPVWVWARRVAIPA
jgi:hypothetical protein